MNLALDLAFWEAEQEGREEGREELKQAILLVRSGIDTAEALEEKGISKSVAEEALKLA